MASETMKLADAQPGDVLLDTCGDEWERTETGAVARTLDPVEWPAEDFDDAEEHFGPFRGPIRGPTFEAAALAD